MGYCQGGGGGEEGRERSQTGPDWRDADVPVDESGGLTYDKEAGVKEFLTHFLLYLLLFQNYNYSS